MIEANIYLSESRFVRLRVSDDVKTETSSSSFSSDEIHGALLIGEILRRISRGEKLPVELRILETEDDGIVVRAQWLKSGKLKFRNEGTNVRKIKFCKTAEEAVAAKSIFTCKKSLFKVLPAIRDVLHNLRDAKNAVNHES